MFASQDAGGESAGKRPTPRSTPNGSDHPARGAEIGRARESHERRQGAERTRTSARSVVPRSGDQTALCLDARVWTTAPPGLGVGEVFVAAVGVSAHAARLVVGRYGAGIRGAPVPPLEDVLFVGLLHELLLSFDEFGVLEDMLDEQKEFGLLSLEELGVLEELDALGEPDPFAEVDVDDCAPVVGAVLVSPVVAFELFGADAPAGSRDIPVRALPGASRSWVTHGSVEEGGGAAAGRGSTDASGPGSCVPGKVQSQMPPSCEPTRLPTSWPKVLAGSLSPHRSPASCPTAAPRSPKKFIQPTESPPEKVSPPPDPPSPMGAACDFGKTSWSTVSVSSSGWVTSSRAGLGANRRFETTPHMVMIASLGMLPNRTSPERVASGGRFFRRTISLR